MTQRQQGATEFSELASGLVELGQAFYSSGLVRGTSGNFSAVVSRDPLRLAITSSGADKGKLTP
ncbi:MAG TPA: class II aldolase/adducin family protein, partial [Blastocatellia bacterium]